MGKGSRTTQTTNQTTQNTTPTWVSDALKGYTGQVSSFGQTDPRSLVAPASALQNQAFQQGGLLGQGSNSAIQGVLDNGADSYQDYMSPYKRDVVDTTLADYDANAGQTRAAQAAAAARNSSFGGSRYGVQEAQTEGQLARGRASTEATLLDQGYNTAQGLFANDQNRQLSAAGLLGSENRANTGLLAGLGETQRGIDANYRTADLSMLQALGGLYGQGQYGLFSGQTQNGTTANKENPGLLSTVGQVAQTGASLAALFSDKRLKRNIVALGGGLYAYNYLWSDDLDFGVMAQEQEHVIEGPGGFLMVDYRRV